MGFFVALQFLTSIPSPVKREFGVEEMGGSTGYFTLVGLTLGFILVILNILLSMIFPAAIANALLVVALIFLTGGLHLDGLMDSCDGLLGSRPPEARLAIMKDSHVGGFGVAGAISIILLKYVALASIPDQLRNASLILAPVLAGWLMSYLIVAFPYARSNEGLGRIFKSRAGRRHVLANTVVAIAIAFIGLQLSGFLVMLGALVVANVLAFLVMRRIPGLTGDVYGAIAEVVHLSVFLLVPVVSGGYGV